MGREEKVLSKDERAHLSNTREFVREHEMYYWPSCINSALFICAKYESEFEPIYRSNTK